MKEKYTRYSHLWQPSVIDNDGNVIKDGVFTWDTLNYLADNPVVLDSFLKDVLEREYTKQQQLKRKRDKGLNRGESIAELAQIRAQMACLISDRDFLYEVHVKEGVKWQKKARDNRSRSSSTSSLSSLGSGLGAKGRSRPSSSSTEHTELYGFDESVEMEEKGGITGARA